MYTSVTFGLFLERLFAALRAESGIEFHRYPNVMIAWNPGDWLYEYINNDFSLRIFRWTRKGEGKIIKGPEWDNPAETPEKFEPRFEKDFRETVRLLSLSSEPLN